MSIAPYRQHRIHVKCHVTSFQVLQSLLKAQRFFAAEAINLRYLRDMKYISLETAAASVSFCATPDQQSSVEETPGRNEVGNHVLSDTTSCRDVLQSRHQRASPTQNPPRRWESPSQQHPHSGAKSAGDQRGFLQPRDIDD